MYNFLLEDAEVFNVRDMMKQSHTENKPLLSAYAGTFWATYVSNYVRFDALFKTKFASWFYFEQEHGDTVKEVTDEFRDLVYAHLLANDKRYSELYRVQNITDDEKYSLTDNVNVTEITDRTANRDIEFNKGSETDTENNTRTKGQEVDSENNSRTKGAEIITEDNSIEYGAHETTVTKSTSAYNESAFTAVDRDVTSSGIHTDNEDKSRTEGQRIDSENLSRTEGQRIDSENLSATSGTRKDTTDDDLDEDITVTRVGNIGVQTVDDMLKKHVDVWSLFDFYGIIFDDIAKSLLRGC